MCLGFVIFSYHLWFSLSVFSALSLCPSGLWILSPSLFTFLPLSSCTLFFYFILMFVLPCILCLGLCSLSGVSVLCQYSSWCVFIAFLFHVLQLKSVATALSLAWYCLSLISNSRLLGLTPAATQLTWQKNTTIKRLSPTVLLCHRCSGRALHHCHISGSHAFWHHHNRFPLWGGSEAATTGTFHYCPHLQLHWSLLKQGLHNNPLGWMRKTCSLVLPQPEEI